MKPRIGIVVPTGRYTPMLKDVLESITRQDLRAQIAVFDASGDLRTKALLDTYSDDLAYVHHGPDGGQANAIRLGWERLDTEIVSWLNDDDFLAPGTLKKVIELIDANPACSGVFGPSVILDQTGAVSGMHPAVDPKRLNEIHSNNVISQPSCFVKHAYVKDIGGINKNLRFTMDWDLWTRLLSKFPDSVVFNEDVLTAVTFSNQTKTAEISLRRMREIYSIARRYNPAKRSLVTVMAFLKWGISQQIHNRKTHQFYKSETDRYVYWNYERPIIGITLTGSLTSQNIKAIESQNKMRLDSSDEDRHKFNFQTPFDPGKLVRISLPDINYSEVDFKVS